jgi:hypothetical protein
MNGNEISEGDGQLFIGGRVKERCCLLADEFHSQSNFLTIFYVLSNSMGLTAVVDIDFDKEEERIVWRPTGDLVRIILKGQLSLCIFSLSSSSSYYVLSRCA